ncbi:hypothetical protein MMC07_003979 [Pseudocyphellaria aurata]|nr:hypothetical protein [Pseudocyphellaria aurata]
MDQVKFPYLEGNDLLLKSYYPERNGVFPVDEDGFIEDRSIKCKIVKFIQSSNFSSVMEVECATKLGQTDRFVLKLFDPRYASQLREDENAKPWDLAQETAFQDFVGSGEAFKFFRYLEERAERLDSGDSIECDELDPVDHDDAQRQVSLDKICVDMYDRECDTYEYLKNLQGEDIPRLIAKVQLSMDLHAADGDRHGFFEIRGVLLELVEGFPLSKLAQSAPREHWQGICDQAVGAIQDLGDLGVLNRDVRPSNFLVFPSPSTSETPYRVVVLGFAQCELQTSIDKFSRHEDWVEAKYEADEEGEIGLTMQYFLKRDHDFDLIYQRSSRYMECAPDEWC